MSRTRILFCYLAPSSLDAAERVHIAVGNEVKNDLLAQFSSAPDDGDIVDTRIDLPAHQKKPFDLAIRQWKSQYRKPLQEIVRTQREDLANAEIEHVEDMYNFFEEGIIFRTVCNATFDRVMDDAFLHYSDDTFLVVFLGHRGVATLFTDKFAKKLNQYKSRVDCGLFFVCGYDFFVPQYMAGCEVPIITFAEDVYLPALYCLSHYHWLFYTYIRWGKRTPTFVLTGRTLIAYQTDNNYPFEAIKKNMSCDSPQRKLAFRHCIAYAKQARATMHLDDLGRAPEEGIYYERVPFALPGKW